MSKNTIIQNIILDLDSRPWFRLSIVVRNVFYSAEGFCCSLPVTHIIYLKYNFYTSTKVYHTVYETRRGSIPTGNHLPQKYIIYASTFPFHLTGFNGISLAIILVLDFSTNADVRRTFTWSKQNNFFPLSFSCLKFFFFSQGRKTLPT